MEKVNSFAERISNRLEQHRHELADKQLQLDGRMKELLDQKERLATIAKRKIDSIILPRMEELALHFDNAKVVALHTDSDYNCLCEFSHTPQFPATVRFDIAILPGENESFTIRYNLNIFPVLMEYKRNYEEVFPLEGEDEALSVWVENRILDFVNTYLRLETHPFYQKDNIVLDIVCGMRIPSTAATSSVEKDGRTFYFCSEHCKDAFIKG